MKRTNNALKTSLLLLLALLMAVSLVACTQKVDKVGMWENATYRKDTELGKGAITVQVEVKAEDQSITFTLHSDKTVLGDILAEQELITGSEGAYGIFVETVNGMALPVENAYWAVMKNGEYASTGVDGITVADGEHYELVYETY